MKTSSLSQTISHYFLVAFVIASLGNLLACQSDTIEPKSRLTPGLVHIMNQDVHAVPRPYVDVDTLVSDSTKRIDPQPRSELQDQ